MVSIIIPMYNVAKYIRECLNSVLTQTLCELEIICVDDGSTDNTCTIVKEYRQRDSRIILLRQDHAGAGLARNLALAKSKGDYVAFLDGDDFYFENTALERMYNEAKKNHADLCSSLRKKLTNGQIENEDFLLKFDCHGKSSLWIYFQDHQNDWHFHNFIFKSKFLKTNEIQFPPYVRYQDPPFLLKAMIIAKKFLFVPTFLYCYRQNYRIFHLTELQTYHILLGIYDNLLLAHRYRYEKLFHLLIDRLNTIYYNDIISNLSTRVLQKLCDIDILCGDFLPKQDAFRLLNDIKTSMQNIRCERYVFPFNFIGSRKKILLYGASVVGQALYYQFVTYGCGQGDIVGFLDADKNVFANNDFMLYTIDEIDDIDFDVIILATENKNVADDMMKKLLERGVNEKKIFWDTHGYRKTHIYEEMLHLQKENSL